MSARRLHVAYVTSPTDGWGEREPTDEERESYCALVEQRLGEWYPNHTVEAYTDRDAGGGEVRTDDPEIDDHDLLCRIQDVWGEWCGGTRATS